MKTELGLILLSLAGIGTTFGALNRGTEPFGHGGTFETAVGLQYLFL
jgi:hypothetical protein